MTELKFHEIGPTAAYLSPDDGPEPECECIICGSEYLLESDDDQFYDATQIAEWKGYDLPYDDQLYGAQKPTDDRDPVVCRGSCANKFVRRRMAARAAETLAELMADLAEMQTLEPQRTFHRLNGKPAVTPAVMADGCADIYATIETARAALEEKAR